MRKWQRLSGEGPLEDQLERMRRIEQRNKLDDLALVLKETEDFNRYLLERGEHDKLVDYSLLMDTKSAQELRERQKRIFDEDLDHEYRPELVNIDNLLSAVNVPE